MSRLLIVANRLPIAVSRVDGELHVERSPGGLATGLSGPHSKSDALWIGWPGDIQDVTDEERESLGKRLDELRAIPVWIPPNDLREFYEGFSNGALWPLFHHLLDQMPLHVQGWEAYERANGQFADEVCRHYNDGDLIWVHDYQLMLLPQMLRDRLPDARIGFFLHIPFPASELFRTIAHRERILEGVLGADLVGFHTAGYMRSFSSSLLRVLGIASNVDRVYHDQREVRLGVFPMGVDTEKFATLSDSPEVQARVAGLRGMDDCAIVLGVDRLDYTKGIRRRLLAYEKFLYDHPELHGRVRLTQIAVPSRTSVEAYQDFRNEVDASIGRINGAFGTSEWAPIYYLYRGISEVELSALYRAADVLLVTPVRDGMNLVAKEFVASRTDDGGVLVLSEFAGAASELAEAVMMNPFDVDRASEVFYRALTLPADERLARMKALRRRVLSYDVHHWVRSYLESLEEASQGAEQVMSARMRVEQLAALSEKMRGAGELLLILGYDGTLVPFASAPELSKPDEELLDLLRRLAARPATQIHLVSGSSRDVIEQRFGGIPIHLHAEYGFWEKAMGTSNWVGGELPVQEWRDHVVQILENFTARTPGSLIEEKTVSVAWHYRMAEPEFAAFQANELTIHLTQLLSNEPVEIVTDDKVIEVRATGVNKGIVVPRLLAESPPDTFVVAMGDDRNDEELFAALEGEGTAIHVGGGTSRADIRVPNIEAARRLLASLLD
ncbi:MAG: bifunctional alpha,alpha-trehalose-phosphate synthase (UDP-forming)/trehalose-phosphatase [Candidatus Binatia bacterium]|nr:bifunctional alpha,alpha-trehalose-phosphate synthase (UDP-forming)/trehalose-phosphatase [Candidatus Binatia bacterium]